MPNLATRSFSFDPSTNHSERSWNVLLRQGDSFEFLHCPGQQRYGGAKFGRSVDKRIQGWNSQALCEGWKGGGGFFGCALENSEGRGFSKSHLAVNIWVFSKNRAPQIIHFNRVFRFSTIFTIHFEGFPTIFGLTPIWKAWIIKRWKRYPDWPWLPPRWVRHMSCFYILPREGCFIVSQSMMYPEDQWLFLVPVKGGIGSIWAPPEGNI